MELFKDQLFGTTQLHEAIKYLFLAGTIENKADAKHIRNFLCIVFSVDPDGVEDPRMHKQIRRTTERRSDSKGLLRP